MADHSQAIDIRNVDGCLALAVDSGIVGVTTVASEVAVRTVGVIADELGLPGPGRRASEIATNKARARAVWDEADVVSPQWEVCVSLDDAMEAVRRIGLPVVVKPTDSSGSRGVTYVDRESNLDSAVERALASSQEARLLVEEFVPGVEMSVEGLVVDGRFTALGLSDKTRTEPPYLLDTVVAFPSTRSKEVQDRACSMTGRAVEAIGLRTAAIHAELMVRSDEVVLIELAARGPGFHVFTHMLPWVTGLDVVSVLVRAAVDSRLELAGLKSKGAVLRFLPARPGRVRAISGIARARELPGVIDVGLLVERGDTIRPLTSGTERAGYVIAVAETRSEAEAICEEVEATIEIVVDAQTRRGAR